MNSIKENSKIGYILEVDLRYCKELHNIHSDYPLCPEHFSVNYEMLSNYSKNIVHWYSNKNLLSAIPLNAILLNT